MKQNTLAGVFLLIFAVSSGAAAHEIRPAYLQISEVDSGRFDVLWKVPQRGEMVLGLHVEWPGTCNPIAPLSRQSLGDALVERRIIDCQSAGLKGQRIGIDGLASTITDALVRIAFADGTIWTQRLTPQQPSVVIPSAQSVAAVSAVYFDLGIEHILTGADHLLFVLAMLIITKGLWRLVKTVTAFTVAHSITLGLAAVGLVHVPQAPVEAVIALSIVFVAAEIVRGWQGHEGLAAQAPWMVAFTFGLLHGFGFAGALREIGLPAGHILLALLFFNLGIEAGQLLFIIAVLSVVALAGGLKIGLPRWVARVPPYAIGSVAMFWVIQRIAAF
jgi:hydrogenase/urease accessory protein HupE